FSFNSSGKLVMERKKDMKKRGLKSPDMGDSLCLTFYPLSPVRKSHRKALKKPKKQVIRKMGY
ncbi:MAG: hypothetical protein KDD50_15365, partial [Bdellovibrionales bacterium]|nr:hypothetical protein [Bdellovibrionales bacterium]